MQWFVVPFGLAALAAANVENAYISSFSRYAASFESVTAGDCRYDAQIIGTLNPVHSRFGQTEEFEPDFDIVAHLVCPRTAAVDVHERLVHTGPMTRERLELLISQRATMTRENNEHRCLVIPALRFQGESLVPLGVESLCRSINP